MPAPKRLKTTFASGFSLSIGQFSTHLNRPAEVIAGEVVRYMFSHKNHSMKEVERFAMDLYEEQLAMHKGHFFDIKFRWAVTSKQQVPPFAETYIFGIYMGRGLLVSVAEPVTFKKPCQNE